MRVSSVDAVPVIDSHVHLYTPEINRDPAGWGAAHGEPHWAALSTRRRRSGVPVQGFPDVDELLRAMDAASVGRSILVGWYWERHSNCAAQNRLYAACVKSHPDRLSACATFHPAAGREAVRDEVQRAHGEGLIGLGELSPHSQGYAPGDPIFRETLELAGRLRMPVNLHVSDPDSGDYPGKISTPLIDFLQLGSDFPNTSFVLAHWGGLLPVANPGAQGLGNLYYDTAASPLMYGADIWKTMVASAGPGKVLYGSDYPLNIYPKLESQPEMGRLQLEAKNSGLGAADLEQILGGNAARVFGL